MQSTGQAGENVQMLEAAPPNFLIHNEGDHVAVAVQDVTPGKGAAVYMDSDRAVVVHLFPTGQGNIIGNPIVPVIKITANPLTARTMEEHIDLDVSGLLLREYNLRTAGDNLMTLIDRTINGRFTCAESLGHREFVITKLYRSA